LGTAEKWLEAAKMGGILPRRITIGEMLNNKDQLIAAKQHAQLWMPHFRIAAPEQRITPLNIDDVDEDSEMEMPLAQLGAVAAVNYMSRRDEAEQAEIDAEEEELWNRPLMDWITENVELAEEPLNGQARQ